MAVDEVLEKVRSLDCPLVEITGGEPLLQKAVLPLMKALCDSGMTVLLETSGAHDISRVDPRVVRIVDVKCPSSGEVERNRLENLSYLQAHDELKFVIGNREDYEWSKDFVLEHQLLGKVRHILFSPIFAIEPTRGQTLGHTGLDSKELVKWILEDKLPVRFQIQIHKYIWDPKKKGV
jgi:7-carboxy-7-deazaguanine synthase